MFARAWVSTDYSLGCFLVMAIVLESTVDNVTPPPPSSPTVCCVQSAASVYWSWLSCCTAALNLSSMISIKIFLEVFYFLVTFGLEPSAVSGNIGIQMFHVSWALVVGDVCLLRRRDILNAKLCGPWLKWRWTLCFLCEVFGFCLQLFSFACWEWRENWELSCCCRYVWCWSLRSSWTDSLMQIMRMVR